MHRFLWVLFVLGLGSARWTGHPKQPKDTTFIGEATNELSTAIFQGYLDDERNIAFSPLGYSAILAILAEGARGKTREQLVSALHLPDDANLTRKTYHFIMERLRNTNEFKLNKPELKNFFYIYRNYTINEEYKKILEDCYLTEVRSVERYNGESSFRPDEINRDGEFVVEIPERESENKDNSDILELLPPPKDGKLISFALEDTPDKVDISNIEYKPAKNIKEKIKLVKTENKDDQGEEEETMVAVEARNQPRSIKMLHDKNDVATSISANSVGRKTEQQPSDSLMIIFNGMYFRGSWNKPFEKVESGLFYKSEKEKVHVPMMKTRGVFKTGTLPGLDSEAIEIPYEDGRYVLLIILPRSRDGLIRLTADLPSLLLPQLQDELTEEELQVCLPTFYVETTTKPIAALAKFGVSSIFSREADLTGVSSDEGLFVQELVQNVAVRVDNAESSASEMSGGAVELESLKNLPLFETNSPRSFSVDRPFLFFIMDRLDKLVVVAGKIIDPEQPTPFDI